MTQNGFIGRAKSVKFVSTQIYNAAAPIAYTDLDTGTGRQCLVYLQVNNTDVAIAAYYFRENGEALNTTEDGVTFANINTGGNHTGYVLVKTDTAGIIEWLASGANTTVIKVLAVLG